MVNIHLLKTRLKTSHMISKLRSKNVIFHDEFHETSLLSHFNQYQLSHHYGGVAMEEYDITKLQTTPDLPGFITRYVTPDEE